MPLLQYQMWHVSLQGTLQTWLWNCQCLSTNCDTNTRSREILKSNLFELTFVLCEFTTAANSLDEMNTWLENKVATSLCASVYMYLLSKHNKICFLEVAYYYSFDGL